MTAPTIIAPLDDPRVVEAFDELEEEVAKATERAYRRLIDIDADYRAAAKLLAAKAPVEA